MSQTTRETAIEGVLFDLDGTLLDLDIDRLIKEYFKELGPVIAPSLQLSEEEAITVVMAGTERMFTGHPGKTNKEIFDTFLFERTGVNYADPIISAPIDEFYRDIFPTFQNDAGPFSGTRAAIQTCFDLGLRVGIATQPIFPSLATQARMRWAEIDMFDLPVVSTYENSHSTKPREDYFCDMAQRIGVDPSRCIMVGDEPVLDMDAANVGMTTFYVGSKPEVRTPNGRGTLEDFVEFLTEISG